MIGLAVYAATLAYGRISKSFGPLHWIIILFIGLGTTILGTPPGGGLSDTTVLLVIGGQIAILAALYAAGVLVGRMLDRDKYPDYGDDEEAA